MRSLLALVTVGAVLACGAGPGLAESGVTRAVTQSATAEGGSGVRQLVVGADVSIGETVRTDGRGLVQLLFRDNSRLVVGPNSTLVIEDFLIRDNNSAGKFAINTLSGAFRFVTGSGRKDDYVIKTPSGTIGVRGTGFDWTIVRRAIPDIVPPAPLSTVVLLFQGALDICNTARRCARLSDACDLGAFNTGGSIVLDNTRATRTALRSFFPLTLGQNRLLAQFRIGGSFECLNPPPDATPTGTSIFSGGGTSTPPPPGSTPTTTTTPPSTPPPTTSPPTTTTPPVIN